MSDVIDLDLLIPKKRKISLAGEEIDLSFIPFGLTLKVSDIMKKLAKVQVSTKDTPETATEKTEQAAELSLEMCALLCSYKNPNITADWLKEHANTAQLHALIDRVTELVTEEYQLAGRHSKNGEAVKNH